MNKSPEGKDQNYQAFLRLRARGEFTKNDPSWFAVIQLGELISVVASYEAATNLPRFDDAWVLIQPITDRPEIDVLSPLSIG
ncbi:MAG: hypothetical protein ABI758_05805 [Candidatus Woesebacteria bacterium]